MAKRILIEFEEEDLKALFKLLIEEVLESYSAQTTPIEKEVLLTIEDVCTLFNKTPQTIHAWKKKGLIPFHRISGRIYFKQSEMFESLQKIEIPKNQKI